MNSQIDVAPALTVTQEVLRAWAVDFKSPRVVGCVGWPGPPRPPTPSPKELAAPVLDSS
jgi:hypothetical protein